MTPAEITALVGGLTALVGAVTVLVRVLRARKPARKPPPRASGKA